MNDLAEKLRFMLITDRKISRLPLPEAVDEILAAGFTAVQLREPDLSEGELLNLAKQLQPIVKKHDALFIINHHLELARELNADGIHLGWKSNSPAEAREITGDELLIGFSAHNKKEVETAKNQGVDYVTLSPIYPTPSKEGLVPILGRDAFKEIALSQSIPAIGLGGVDGGNAADVFKAGADGIAMIRAVLASETPGQAARSIIESCNF